MVDQMPQWGRANRRIERQAARELAKSLVREGREPKQFRWDITLACLVAAMAVIITIAPPQSRLTMCVWLVVMAGLGAYPAFHLSEWIPLNAKWVARVLGLILLLAAIVVFGYMEWPPIKRHTLSAAERVEFENALRTDKDMDVQVQIGCPASDEKTCIYAEQFIDVFGEAGWNIQPSISRLTLSKAQDGVVVYRHGGNKQDMMRRWNAGGWLAINEPHLIAIQRAFRTVHIEIDGSTNPDLADNVAMIYIGSERDNEAQPTQLVRDQERFK